LPYVLCVNRSVCVKTVLCVNRLCVNRSVCKIQLAPLRFGTDEPTNYDLRGNPMAPSSRPTTATLAKEREQTGHGIFDAAPVPQSYQQQQQQVYKLPK
jgi:hypothetical protein